MSDLDVSVVVPAYNAAASLPACLAALERQTLPRSRYEVLVVDDGSTDETAAVAGRFAVRVLRQPHSGAAAARNWGAEQARGAIVAYTDADCQPLPTWLDEQIAPLVRDPTVTATRGVYRTAQRTLLARFVQLEYEERYARARRFATLDFVDTYAAAYRRQALLASGGFDTSFRAATVEDHELSYRLSAAGHRLVFAPAATVLHQHVTTPAAYARRKWRIGRDKVRVHLRHPARLAGDSHTPRTLTLQVGLALLLPATLAAMPWYGRARAASALLGAAFLASTAPLAARAWRDDRALTPWVPPLVALRAGALAGGLAAGTARALWISRTRLKSSQSATESLASWRWWARAALPILVVTGGTGCTTATIPLRDGGAGYSPHKRSNISMEEDNVGVRGASDDRPARGYRSPAQP